MLKERIEAIRPVGPAMHELEDAWNLVLVRHGEALAAIARARMNPSLHAPLEIGMAATEALVASAASAAKGYRETVIGHRHLGDDRDRLLPKTVAFGDEFYTPPKTAELADAPAERHLHVVAEQAKVA